jgi:type II secretory pathway pseudopilin PulG
MIGKVPWPEVVVIALVLAIGGGVFLYAHKDEDSLEESKRRGADIVEALAEYRADHGTYPNQLAMLAPRYVDAVEPPTWGLREWRYRTYTPGALMHDDDRYFQLSVAANESGYPALYYDVRTGRWALNN